MRRASLPLVVIVTLLAGSFPRAASEPVRARGGMVVAQERLAAQVGADILRDGGNAIDATVATAFALAVTFPFAGNIGGGGFMIVRTAGGETAAYDFRETAPAGSSPTMFMREGRYDARLHHDSHLAVGVPGTVAGLHMAWRAHGTLPWQRLVRPAITLARDGFVVSDGLARSLAGVLDEMTPYPASMAQFSKNGVAYEAGDTLRQPDLAASLERIAAQGPAGFYEGETALAIEREMAGNGGLITQADLRAYRAVRRQPLTGRYRDYEILAMPPPSSGGVVLLEALNILEGYDLRGVGAGSAAAVHHMAEATRRGFADRARYLGDPEANPDMPIARLLSREHAQAQRETINSNRASTSSPTTFTWPAEGNETTHVSVVDANRNAVSMTYTLEDGYGSKITVPGTGILLNNEMGDFNAGPGLTDATGLIGTPPNLAAPGKRMLSSMAPTIVTRRGELFMVTGSPGGRTIINTVLQTIVNVVDFGMNAQEAVDFGRFHHQWLPDRIQYERNGLSPDTLADLRRRGHTLLEVRAQGSAQVIVVNSDDDALEGGSDRRTPDAAAIAADR